MRAGILRSREGWHIDRLEEAFRRRGVEPVKMSITDLVLSIDQAPYVAAGGVALDELDTMIVRVIPLGSMEQLMFRLNTLHRLAGMGVRVVNAPGSIEKTVDKSYTSSLLFDAGLPTPRTVVCEKFDDAMTAFEKMGDAIVKPLHGSCGVGMTRISDKDTAYRVFRAMELNRFVYYLQEYIDHGGEDVRVFVAGGEVVAAMKRTSGGWKNNVRNGAKVSPHAPSCVQIEWALRAAAVLELDYAGIDFLAGPDGADYIIEVNGIPGWKGLQQTTGVSIADTIVNRALDDTSEKADHRRGGGDGVPARSEQRKTGKRHSHPSV